MIELLTDQDYETIIAEIDGQNDRGAAITACAFVEDHLKWAIGTRFVSMSKSKSKNLFGGSGPLGSFDAKITMAHALGLCSEYIIGELKQVGEIRNKFAHSMKPVLFTDSVISGLCSRLKMAKARKKALPTYNDPRDQYVFTCKTLMPLIVTEALEKTVPTPPIVLADWASNKDLEQKILGDEP